MYYVWNLPTFVTTLIYVCAIFTFQMAWALDQISHLSLIPELTSSSVERGKLTSIRCILRYQLKITMHTFIKILYICNFPI